MFLVGASFTLAGFAASLPAPADREVSPREAMNSALRELIDEAQESKRTFMLPRVKSDFAADFVHSLDDELIVKRIERPVDRDPFVDAYVRWQLTSFLDRLPAMDDEEFEDFLRNMPACVPNPQIDQRFVQPLMRAGEAGELSPGDQKQAMKLVEELEQRRNQASALRRPAEMFRDWVAEHVGEEGHRPLQLSLERCAAFAKSGWDLDECKADITRKCEAALRDRSFTNEQRERVARQMEGLTQFSSLLVTGAYLDERVLIVSTASIGVFDFEVRKWQRTLLGE